MPEDDADPQASRRDAQVLLDGVHLAARTLEYHLSSDLTLTIGYAELLAEDPELPERLRDMARLVLESAQSAVASVRRMRRVGSIKLVDQGIAGGPLLDLGPAHD